MNRKKFYKVSFISIFLLLSLVLMGWLSFSQEKQKQEINQQEKILKPPTPRVIGPYINSFQEMMVTNPSVGALPTEFLMKGSRFGATQGSRVICIAGAQIGSDAIFEWYDTEVMFPVYGGHPSVPSLNRGQHYMVWIEDGYSHRISNKYNYLHLMIWDGAYPDKGSQGSKISLKTYENFPFFSPTQGSFKVMFDTWEATVKKWDSKQITVVVPNVQFPPHTRSLEVKVFISTPFGKCVSSKRDFTVLKTKSKF